MAKMGTEKQQKQCGGEEDPNSTSPFISCAELIFPWLNTQELATAASTCKSLAQLARLITLHRSSDASRSLEKLPIPFHTSAAQGGRHSPRYAYFLYSPSQLLSSQSPNRQPWGFPNSYSVADADSPATENGCGCGCGCEGCGRGDASLELEDLELGVLSECGPSCECGFECRNRLTQRGIGVKLKIVWDEKKGWGLFADQLIPSCQFICEYTGELLTTTKARQRQQVYDQLSSGAGGCSSALLVVREHLPSGKACLRVNIDATKIGNVARFINHSCDGGNLWTATVRSPGACFPRLCFFASRDIQAGEELSFSYGETRLRSNGLQCFCGTSSCSGTLPSEVT
ncbi:Histone-lysine N-methyltransferase SUVR3 [Linum grandiflorum]